MADEEHRQVTSAKGAVPCIHRDLISMMQEMRQVQRDQVEAIARQSQLIEEHSQKLESQSTAIAHLSLMMEGIQKGTHRKGGMEKGVLDIDHLAGVGKLSSPELSLFESFEQRIDEMSKQVDTIVTEVEREGVSRRLGMLLSMGVKPSDDEVTALIRAGADVHYYDPNFMSTGVLHALATHRLLHPLGVVLEKWTEPLDLRLTDNVTGNTMVHVIVQCNGPSEQVETMLTMVRDRLQNSRARTLVDWNQRNASGDDVVNAAARHGRLSLFWKCMASISYWDDKTEGEIELHIQPKRGDWEALGETNQSYFSGKGVDNIRKNEKATQELLQLYKEKKGKPSVTDIERYVASGADVMALHYGVPLLNLFIHKDYGEAVRACLKSPCGIDFTVVYRYRLRFTPLHYIVGKKDKDRMRMYLPIIFDRLLGADHSPDSENPDTIDWTQKNSAGYDCISWSAYNGNLFEFWAWVKSRGVPYYMNNAVKISIRCKVHVEDYKRLSEEDKQRFDLRKGFRD